ncbi:hypothetical protein FRB96_007348 [Tulasnella sp. 330]|nr:hypothetical protein FRB96_007348 [Tulasnella sp. 330]KAG8876727.1 hypothetical protein FRB97_003969 [Tulasnella sp. 331]KAG8882428.1 hypothetical protein FRB98_003710 [Tulasnella sp. 332]
MAHIHGNATHSNLRLRDAQDAHVLFQAVRQGHLQLIRKRLTPPEQQALHAGQVFVWADREGSLERWTDGHNWSPSRVRGPFLMYDEMPEDTEAFLRRKQMQKSGERRVKQPRKKRLPPLPGGLSKQTYSATLIQQGMDIQKWHVTAYFQEDGSSEDLPTIDDDTLLRTIIVPESTFKSSMIRKTKGSVSRRRDSMSTTGGERPILDDGDLSDGALASPIEEYPPSPPLDSRFGASPPDQVNQPGLQRSTSNNHQYFPDAPINALPWEMSAGAAQSGFQPIHTHRGRMRTESGDNESGSSSGSNGTMQAERSQFYGQQPPNGSPNIINRGRPMHLEGMHNNVNVNIYDNPHLSFSALSSHPEPRPSSMPVADWRTSHLVHQAEGPGGTHGDEHRRGSLMSIGSSRSASSTSTSQSTGNSSRIHPSSDSSPASSWTQPSPYLAGSVPSASGSGSMQSSAGAWQTSQQQGPQQRVKLEHPLAQTPLYPMSAPNSQPSFHETLSHLPAHLQHHPEVVPSAVPPPFTMPSSNTASRKPTLPYNLSTETVMGYAQQQQQLQRSTSQHGQTARPQQTPTQLSTENSYNTGYPSNQGYSLGGLVSSPVDVKPAQPPLPRNNSSFGPSSQQLSYPPAAMANQLPGSWESSQRQGGGASDFSSFSLAGYAGSPPHTHTSPQQFAQPNHNNNSNPQLQYPVSHYTIPGPGEIFDSSVPSSQHLPSHQQSWP